MDLYGSLITMEYARLCRIGQCGFKNLVIFTLWAAEHACVELEYDVTQALRHLLVENRYQSNIFYRLVMVNCTSVLLRMPDERVLPFFHLANMRSVESLLLSWSPCTGSNVQSMNRGITRDVSLEKVTYLRLRNYPRCLCKGKHSENSVQVCVAFYLPTYFPKLQHLHFEEPYFLKRLVHPPGLERVTLEAPPDHSISSLGAYTSIASYNIASALRAGFLRRKRVGDPRKLIVVNTGTAKPVGWQDAVAACHEYDVSIEFRCTYPD
ncbi:hypothetical protein BKA93DRAFT_788061 [Sparassis latifolia]